MAFKSGCVVFNGVVLLRSFGTGYHVDNLVVPVVPDVDLVAHVPLEDLIPLLLGDKGGGVHGAAVADDQAVALAGLGEGKEGVLDLDHGAQKVFLELDLSVLGQIGKVDSSAEKDGGGLRDPIHLPAQVLEEGREPRLAGGLASAWSSRQHQLPDLPLLLLRLHHCVQEDGENSSCTASDEGDDWTCSTDISVVEIDGKTTSDYICECTTAAPSPKPTESAGVSTKVGFAALMST